MYREIFIGEKFVSHVWDGRHFAEDALRAKDGRKIKVIYQGQWNDDSGADFRNAEIEIDGQIQRGNVEVHVKTSHWRVHHHDVDPRHNDTILHVAMWDDSTSLLTKKQDGGTIPTLILYNCLDSSIGKLWKTMREGEKEPSPCGRRTGTMAPEAIGAILDRAGRDRFLRRAEVFEERLEEISEDQLLYEGIMEALGYSKNREQFLDLARRVPLETLTGQTPEKIQAVLFSVAGLLPSRDGKRVRFDQETEEYVDRMEAFYRPFLWEFKDRRMSGEQWEFFRIRPENLPTKRIAGLSYILSKCGNEHGSPSVPLLARFLSAFGSRPYKVSNVSRSLGDILMPRASGYWTKHYTFGGKRHKENPFLIGQSRSDDIVINVVLPVALAHAQRSRDEELHQVVIGIYSSYRRLQDNKITRYVASRLFRNERDRSSVINSAMRQQGLLHIYRSFCSTRDCQNCPLMEENI